MGYDSGVSPGNESGRAESPATIQFAKLDHSNHRRRAPVAAHAPAAGTHEQNGLAKNGLPHLHIETEEDIPGNDPRPQHNAKDNQNNKPKKGPTQVTELTDLEVNAKAGKL